MKKIFLLLIIFVVLVFADQAMAQEVVWYPVDQITVHWLAVTEDVDGDALPTYATLRYKVYLVDAVGDPDRLSPIEVANIPAPAIEVTITIPSKGQYYSGVEAVLEYIDGSIDQSGINWADQPEDQNGITLWAIRRSAPPKIPQEYSR